MKPLLSSTFLMVLFVKYVVLTFESVDEFLWCYHSNETSSAVLSRGTICLVCSSNFWVRERNLLMWLLKWNLFGCTFTCYHSFFSILKNEIWIFFCPILTSAAALEGERVKCILFHLSLLLYYTETCSSSLYVFFFFFFFFSSLLGYFDVVKIKFRPWWTESLQWLSGYSIGTRTQLELGGSWIWFSPGARSSSELSGLEFSFFQILFLWNRINERGVLLYISFSGI